MDEKKRFQLILIILIMIVGLVECVFLICTKTMRIHHLGFCALGLVDTIVAFVRRSEYKWCDLTFTVVYFLLLMIGLLLTS